MLETIVLRLSLAAAMVAAYSRCSASLRPPRASAEA